MNRRSLLKALAALPFVGRLVKESQIDYRDVKVKPLGLKSFPIRPSYDHPTLPDPGHSYTYAPPLPDLCPLCELRWNEHREPGGFFKNEDCFHRCVIDQINPPSKSFYVAQLRRRRKMKEAVILTTAQAYLDSRSGVEMLVHQGRSEQAGLKIHDIDAVLRFLGEAP